MSFKTTHPKHQSKTPKEAFVEQISLALDTYVKAERSKRVKRALAQRKTIRK